MIWYVQKKIHLFEKPKKKPVFRLKTGVLKPFERF